MGLDKYSDPRSDFDERSIMIGFTHACTSCNADVMRRMLPSVSLNSKYRTTTIPDTDDAAPSTELPEVLQFMQLLWAVAHGLERASKRMSGEIGVTGPQRLVLRVAGLFPGLSAGDLATILHVHPSTLTGILQRLVDQRLLVRLDDPRDRRRAVLRLTARGGRINAVGHGTVESAVAEALDGLNPRDLTATRRVLERLALHLQPSDGKVQRPARRPPARGRMKRITVR
jgi:DNA-binding MarR family transcriptional regulator